MVFHLKWTCVVVDDLPNAIQYSPLLDWTLVPPRWDRWERQISDCLSSTSWRPLRAVWFHCTADVLGPPLSLMFCLWFFFFSPKKNKENAKSTQNLKLTIQKYDFLLFYLFPPIFFHCKNTEFQLPNTFSRHFSILSH